ncbi:MAG TPA: ImmA/IrrE family metallo-endopeptidase, partial [Streptosporangiaceae bacterium]
MTSGHAPAWPVDQPGPLRTGQDWANWLRHNARGQSPGGVRPPGRMGLTEAWNALVHVARRAGFAVRHEDCGNAEGFTTWPDRRIHIHANAAPVQAVTALAHQIGHVLLHEETARVDPSGTVPCHGLRKVEADSVAYLTLLSLGIGTQAIGFPNVSAWAGTDPRANPAAAIRTVASRVLAATDTILTHLESGLPHVHEGDTQAVTAATVRDLFGTPQPSPPLADLARLNEIAARYFRRRLPGSWVPGYLKARGFASGVQQRWMVGYAPAAWDDLTRHLRSLGYPDTLIEASGLARRSRRGTLTDTFRDRAILPIRTTDGTTLGFIGRAPAQAARSVPKYLNSPSTGLYDKSET